MSLSPGTRLGPYEILSAVGAGGMGEVYRARDTKLHRDVAIKVLPALFAADPDRLARFDREAQSLAALNHTNIAQVFGQVELPADADLPAQGGSHTVGLVMELVEGEDLSQRIARGAIPIDEALPMARQIADALEAAHERGIIHRDLKPANIKVRDDGTVKVLDFGLAKPAAVVQGFSPADTDSPQGLDDHRNSYPAENSPTFTSPAMTQMGVILGTAAYMAPEQAKGRPVDKRADIWAFGCVLFEMLTAKRPFAGEDVTETVASIVKDEPAWNLLPADLSPPVVSLLHRCLTKDPRQRLRDIGEARVMLGVGGLAGAVQRPSRARGSLLRALALIVGGALLGAAVLQLVPSCGVGSSSAAPAFTLRRLTELPGPELHPDISPDGRQIVFTSGAAGNLDVYLLRVGGARPLNLTADSSGNDQQASFSPSGDQIAFRSDREGGGLFVMGATGESVRRVTRDGFDPAWSPDGKSLAYATEPVLDPYARYGISQLWTVDIASGETTRLPTVDGVQPTWSPDGGRIAYWANTGGQRDIWTIGARGGTPVAVTKDVATDWSPEWSVDGRWLYFSSDRGGNMNLWKIAIDQRTGAPRGAPETVTTSLQSVGYARFASDPRRAILMAYTTTHELLLTPIEPTPGARRERPGLRSASLGWCSPSPAADWLVCTSRTAQEDIVLMRPDGSETIRLTDDAPKDRNPSWAPDGSRIAFMSTRSGTWELWSIRRDGSDLRQMTDLRSSVYDAVWSKDGRRALTADNSGVWIFDVAVLATRGTARFVKFDKSPDFSAEAWSPDGTLVAGSILDSTGIPLRPAVWDVATGTVRPFDVPGPEKRLSFAAAGWLGDSRRFLFASGKGLVVVDAVTGEWASFPAPENGSRYRLSGDAKTLYAERDTLDADLWLMEAVGR